MKRSLILLFAGAILVSCNAQSTQTEKGGISKAPLEKTNENQPQVDIKVNKEYDEDGNLIKYDSSYVEYYSNWGGDSILLDSLYSGFEPFMNEHYSDWFNRPFDPFFFNDTLMNHDFFNNNYFQKRFELNQKQFQQMFEEMDSLKLKYFEEFDKQHNKK
ncbi:hypothetical protein MNBD_BACTEROID06-500 [hydrothermal vent metagenome]|uniref:Lipoprotein n=1 Tax=hydrothermal vent metagenome TaxID=652676 RepID=A0A3B0V7W7_9ZZZZ